MQRTLQHLPGNAYLAAYHLPPLAFDVRARLSECLTSTWAALREGDVKRALAEGYRQVRGLEGDTEEKGALLAALAAAELRNGQATAALRAATASLDVVDGQWMARRVLYEVHLALQAPHEALRCIQTIDGEKTCAWDEPLPDRHRYLAVAACSWLLNDWEAAAAGLARAFPEGVATMPAPIQEDWFRLAFYRESPVDAADAAVPLIATRSTESADVLLQTLVKQGWHDQALSLYRVLFDRDNGNELIRRRLVGLCIRAGEVDEARRLMERGVLRLAV